MCLMVFEHNIKSQRWKKNSKYKKKKKKQNCSVEILCCMAAKGPVFKIQNIFKSGTFNVDFITCKYLISGI